MQLILLLSLIYLAFSRVSCGHSEKSLTFKYTINDFNVELPKTDHFVMFYVPWCQQCTNLLSTWDQLAKLLSEKDANIRVAKVDCMDDAKLCSEQDITGYPVLKLFKVGNAEGILFRGLRDLTSLTNFINEQFIERKIGHSEMGKEFPLKELNFENFDTVLEEGKSFVKFYAPWCGHCQRLAPTWLALAKAMEFNEEITIAKIDCTEYRGLCSSYDVRAYPTLLWFENGQKLDRYTGERSLEELKKYVNKMAGAKIKTETTEQIKTQVVEEGEPVVDLGADIFKEEIKEGITFVDFFSPWCGHCKRLAPTWEQLGKKLQNTKGVKIAKVDCTVPDNREFCNQQEIDSFPSLFLYKDGEKISQYSGNRELQDLYDFVNTHIVHDEL
ncbi:thioredoxin domain-containing protein pretaporter [Rhynchophorus ferrugineus]|uniref:Thioredoxin domain-containing protein n=1 Tax=Rhynchophorus ferrugineus TaxID=354439 RepID=A0A834HUY9_RHYFE|nr:hypothetical protein GWI33_018912 [Rhynchophorus ferrugineus]